MSWRTRLVAMVLAGLIGVAEEGRPAEKDTEKKAEDGEKKASEGDSSAKKKEKGAQEGSKSADGEADKKGGEGKQKDEKKAAGGEKSDKKGEGDAASSADGSVAGPEAADRSERPSAENVLRNLLERREAEPIVEPSEGQQEGKEGGEKAGKASGPITVREEGQFIVRRRVRVVRAQPDGPAKWLVTFQGDSQGLDDPPVFLMPCQLLEKIERLSDEKGQQSFLVSGQVFTYRNANYLLPTYAVPAPDRRNVQP